MTLIVVVALIVVAVIGVTAHRKYWYHRGVIDGAQKMARQVAREIVREASLRDAARRLDTEWERDHGRPA